VAQVAFSQHWFLLPGNAVIEEMMRTLAVLFLLALPLNASASSQGEGSLAAANPIRKVVTMLQNMVKKVEAEGEKEKELFEKYMCYCKTSGGALSKSIGDAGTKMPQLEADIKEGEAKKAQFEEDIKQHQTDRSAAKEAMASATTLREKEAAAYAKESSEDSANIAATAKAITAIEKGMGAAFLQTNTASILRRLAEKRQEEDLVSFLSGTQGEGYAPASGEIVGILKTMHDEMTADFNEEKAAEAAAIKAYDELMAAKTKEVNALTKALEEKMTRVGELGVEIASMKNDLGDTAEALIEDKKFLADLEKNCETKSAEWEVIVKTRNEELLALADTIKVLNDDDALELFKKTLPGSSFVQVQVTSSLMRSRALATIQRAMSTSTLSRPHLDFIALAIRGKKIGFEKVIAMIDEMVATLKTEQQDDDHKKEYCAAQFDQADDKKKSLEKAVADLETAIEDTKEGISTLEAEIDALQASIKALDKAVAEATDQRKEENEDYTELMASDSAAKELLGFAKNRLNKFYNPKLYKAPPKRVLSEEDRITVANGGTLAPTAAPGGIAGTGIAVLADVSEHSQAKPPPPPEAPGAYKKKGEESGGVIAMIDLLVKDLDKEMTESTTEEKDAQADYEQMMKDSAAKRADDSKTLADKEGALADMQASLQKSTDSKASTTKELAATLQYIQSLHAECDWLLQYFDVRKEARTSEIDALGKAKAVLSGADYSLVQMKASKFLKRA
jgi:septal ring factor EnvC (AmiA/AmiB activator)